MDLSSSRGLITVPGKGVRRSNLSEGRSYVDAVRLDGFMRCGKGFCVLCDGGTYLQCMYVHHYPWRGRLEQDDVIAADILFTCYILRK